MSLSHSREKGGGNFLNKMSAVTLFLAPALGKEEEEKEEEEEEGCLAS